MQTCALRTTDSNLDNIVRMFHETVTVFSDMMDEQKDIAAKVSLAANLVQEYQDALAHNHTAIINSTRDAFNSVLSQIIGTNTELSRVRSILGTTGCSTDNSTGCRHHSRFPCCCLREYREHGRLASSSLLCYRRAGSHC